MSRVSDKTIKKLVSIAEEEVDNELAEHVVLLGKEILDQRSRNCGNCVFWTHVEDQLGGCNAHQWLWAKVPDRFSCVDHYRRFPKED